MKKIIIVGVILIIIALIIGGYFYYITRLQPSLFVSSFCEKLEYEGSESIDLWDYLLSDSDVIPMKSWEDCINESQTKNPDLSKEKIFEIWKKVYLSSCSDYIDVSIEYPHVYVMSREVFEKTYKGFSFSNFSIDYKEYKNKWLKASGYVDVKFKGSSLGNSMFGGKQKFNILVINGSQGWKVIAFALDY